MVSTVCVNHNWHVVDDSWLLKISIKNINADKPVLEFPSMGASLAAA